VAIPLTWRWKAADRCRARPHAVDALACSDRCSDIERMNAGPGMGWTISTGSLRKIDEPFLAALEKLARERRRDGALLGWFEDAADKAGWSRLLWWNHGSKFCASTKGHQC